MVRLIHIVPIETHTTHNVNRSSHSYSYIIRDYSDCVTCVPQNHEGFQTRTVNKGRSTLEVGLTAPVVDHAALMRRDHGAWYVARATALIDDLVNEDGEQGAGHTNASELTRGLFYGYVVVDVEGLVKSGIVLYAIWLGPRPTSCPHGDGRSPGAPCPIPLVRFPMA